MPHHDADSSLVEVKVHDAVGHGPGDAAVGDLPHLDCAVLRGRGDDIVIVRTPGDVQHWALMTSHQGYIRGHSPSLNSKLTLKELTLNAEFKFEENVPWQVGGQGRHLLRQIQQSLQEIKVEIKIQEKWVDRGTKTKGLKWRKGNKPAKNFGLMAVNVESQLALLTY